MAKEAKLFASSGGPIVFAQIENDYGNFWPNNPKSRNQMYHGGTNFRRMSGGPMIVTSYDYDAPLDEYGNLNQPKWGHLRDLHVRILLHLSQSRGLGFATVYALNLTTYINNATGERFCFLSNTKTNEDANIDLQQDGIFFVPAWIYYYSSRVQQGNFQQCKATSDETDYLRYITRYFDFFTVSVKDVHSRCQQCNNTEEHDLACDFFGTSPACSCQSAARLQQVFHSIYNLTSGKQNYGEFFDEGPEGIAGAADLSSNQWAYKIGLGGEAKRLYDPNSGHRDVFRTSAILPVGRAMTWYKTTFHVPSGTDPLVLNLQGMGKGHAWVNGHSLGRFWPMQSADPTGYSGSCDYRGKYDKDKCLTNCGNPTQRWKHIATFMPNGRIISVIQFASFGNPEGTCGSLQKGDFEAAYTAFAVEKACVGKESCSLGVSESTLGVKNFGNNTGSSSYGI
ncbi:beta-galactosidase, putative [Ricinus communis]|uniref:beta-galactosidase n=1 Tax=Ricinus communis TaxID=3988 RepID=B9RR66_RICCO|nr:beta-galactosidase, putative [Ricinus communis]